MAAQKICFFFNLISGNLKNSVNIVESFKEIHLKTRSCKKKNLNDCGETIKQKTHINLKNIKKKGLMQKKSGGNASL